MKSALASTLLVCLFATGSALAQGQPAAQHAEDFAHENQVFDTDKWVYLHTTTIKMPEQKDLFISATTECALFEGSDATPFADAVILLTVTVNGKSAGPGRFASCGKTAGENAKVTACTDANGGRAHWSRCNLTQDEKDQIKRASRTVTANWWLKDVGVGVKEVIVKAFLWKGATASSARAFTGNGSLMVEITRLVKGS